MFTYVVTFCSAERAGRYIFPVCNNNIGCCLKVCGKNKTGQTFYIPFVSLPRPFYRSNLIHSHSPLTENNKKCSYLSKMSRLEKFEDW